ncbi:MAG: SMP-30/gluconolactonase/LRE family protein [Planctomycetes bacterium]|nr:SMP-30/gluconolactonase/LRE family protein [Planctomycetota bacterium]
MKIEKIADYACNTGEGCIWHPLEKAVYWTDIPAGKFFRYDPKTNTHKQVYEGRQVAAFTIQADGSMLLFQDKGTVSLWKDGKIAKTIVEDIPLERDTRFNDVCACPEGRVYCGTMPVRTPEKVILRDAKLYRLDRDASVHQILAGIHNSNGSGFSPDQKTFFYTDTGMGIIYRFDYDRASGELTRQRNFTMVPPAPASEGKPDGMTVDAEGNVWGARWGGGCVVCYGPDGVEKFRVKLPTPNTSCPCFGGENLDELYVTTAGGHERDKLGPDAGALFRITGLNAKGKPEHFSRIGI